MSRACLFAALLLFVCGRCASEPVATVGVDAAGGGVRVCSAVSCGACLAGGCAWCRGAARCAGGAAACDGGDGDAVVAGHGCPDEGVEECVGDECDGGAATSGAGARARGRQRQQQPQRGGAWTSDDPEHIAELRRRAAASRTDTSGRGAGGHVLRYGAGEEGRLRPLAWRDALTRLPVPHSAPV